MKKLLAFATLSLLIVSCKKEKTTTPDPVDQPTYTYVTTTGSYWVYSKYLQDSLGNETAIPDMDTITLVGDTLVNGKTYYKYSGDISFYSSGTQFQRDSSGYVVDLYGKILYSFNNVVSTLISFPDGPYTVSYNLGANTTISTVDGSKNACTAFNEIGYTNGNPINACGDLTMKFYRYYASGIGLLQDETETYTGLQTACSKKVRKLSSYYIAP